MHTMYGQCGFITNKRNLIAYCSDPAHLIKDPMEVFGYTNPAIPGSSVTFGYSPGYSLIAFGSNTSICVGIMETGNLTQGRKSSGKVRVSKLWCPISAADYHLSIYTSTIEGAQAEFVCQSTFQIWHWSLCQEVNVTAVCTKEGNWEPITNDMCTELTGILLLLTKD